MPSQCARTRDRFLPGLYSSGRRQGVQWNGQQSGRVRLRARTWHVRGLGELLQVEWAQYLEKESISLDFSRSNARGRSDLHSPNDAWTPQTHESSGIRQDRRGNHSRRLSVRAATLASQRPVARGFASRSTGLAGHVGHYTSALKTRARRAVPRAGWLAGPGIPPGERRWDSEASSEAAGRRERTALMSGYGTVGPSSWYALGGPHHGLGNGGCCEMGEPAGVLFDTAACNDQPEYDDRSVRETDRGSCRAASGVRRLLGERPLGLCTPG